MLWDVRVLTEPLADVVPELLDEIEVVKCVLEILEEALDFKLEPLVEVWIAVLEEIFEPLREEPVSVEDNTDDIVGDGLVKVVPLVELQ